MNLEKIPLKTVRQFLIQDVVLADYQDVFTPDTPQVTKKVENLCYAKVTLAVTIKHVEPVLHLLLRHLSRVFRESIALLCFCVWCASLLDTMIAL